MSQEQLNLETSKIHWKELQRFFAQGRAIFTESNLDLLEVANHFAKDNTYEIQHWMQQNKVCPISDEKALEWYETDKIVWAVVVKPWVLVQAVDND